MAGAIILGEMVPRPRVIARREKHGFQAWFSGNSRDKIANELSFVMEVKKHQTRLRRRVRQFRLWLWVSRVRAWWFK